MHNDPTIPKLVQKNTWLIPLTLTILSSCVIYTVFMYRYLNGLTVHFGAPFYETQLLYQKLFETFSFSALLRSFFSYAEFQAFLATSLQKVASNEFISGILFVLSIVLLLLYLHKKDVSDGRYVFTAVFCIFSPSLILSYLYFTPALFAIPLLLALVIGYEYESQFAKYLFHILASIVSFEATVISLLLAIIYNKPKPVDFHFIIRLIISCFVFVTHFSQISLDPTFSISFFESGNLGGIPVYLYCLGLIGFSLLWQKKHKLIGVLNLSLIALSFYVPSLLPYLVFVLAYYASETIERLYVMDWKQSYLKIASLLLVYCLIIAGFIFFVQSATTQEPTFSQTHFYASISENLGTTQGATATILTLPRHEAYIAYFTKATTVTVDDIGFYQSTNLEETLATLKMMDVEYILIDEEMKDGEIWILDNAGLLLLFTNTQVFKPVIETSYATIYWVDYP